MWDFLLGRSLMFLLTCGAIGAFAFLWLMRRRFNASTMEVVVITVASMIWGVFWLKMFAIFEDSITAPLYGTPNKPDNMRLYGAVFFDPVLFFVVANLKKADIREVSDIFGIACIITWFFGRLNCFFAGCCVSDAFTYPMIGTVIWPIRELEELLYLTFIIVYIPAIVRRETYGQVFPMFMVTYGAVRFFIEWARASGTYYPVGPFHLAHIWSVLCLGIGLLMLRRVKAVGQDYSIRKERLRGGTNR